MKLEDFKRLKQSLKTHQLQEFRGWIGERFFINKEVVVQLTDEEKKELAHELSTIEDGTILSIVNDEIEFLQRTGVRS